MKPVHAGAAYRSRPTSGKAAPWSRVLGVAGFAVTLVLAQGCARQSYQPIDLARAISHGNPIRVTMRDGRIFPLEKPVVVNDSLMGTVPGKPPRDIAVPANEILRVERMQSGPKALVALLGGAALLVILIVSGVIGPAGSGF